MKTTTNMVAVLFLLAGVCLGQTGAIKKIGALEWMTMNLDVRAFRNGDPIPEARSEKEWQQAAQQGQPAWCLYQNDPAAGKKYGKLYNWFAVNDARGLAPAGWHVAKADEWQKLVESCGGMDFAGGKLKESGLVHWQNPNAGADNATGFSALPGGYRDNLGKFFTRDFYGAFWTATECGRLSAWARHLTRGDAKIYLDGMSKGYGFAVRCIKE